MPFYTSAAMKLRDFFEPKSISLDLRSVNKDAVLTELVSLLGVDERSRSSLVRLVQRREQLGSTGIGRGVAVPHCRSLVVNRLRVSYGRHVGGLDFGAIDSRPVHHFFLIVAPPAQVANQYLPVLSRIAQLAKEADAPDRLLAIHSVDEFLAFLAEKRV